MLPSHASLATRVPVLAADGESGTNSFVARRWRLVLIELLVDAAPNRFRQRNPETSGMAGQLAVLIGGDPCPWTHHDVAKITSHGGTASGAHDSSTSP